MFTENYDIRFEDLDLTGHLSIFSLIKLAQHAATASAESYGAGYYPLREQGACWVAVRAHYEFGKSLSYGDTLVMNTWPENARHMLYPRMYDFTDAEGNCVMKGSSQWSIYGFEQGRALQSNEITVSITGENRPDGFEICNPSRIKIAKTDNSVMRKVQFSDADANGHLNNCYYISYIMDLLPLQMLGKCKVKSLDINYNSQIRAGKGLKLSYSLSENVFLVSGDDENTNIFTAKVVFEPLDGKTMFYLI